MKRPLYNIIRLVLVIIPVLLTMAKAVAQTDVYQGQTTTLEIEQKPGDTYTWELYSDSTVNFAQAIGDTPVTDASFVSSNTGPSVEVSWHQPGVYFYKVTAVNSPGCTNNLKVGRIRILEGLPTATMVIDPICMGDPAILTVELTGTAPWSITYTNGTDTETISGITESTYEITMSPGPTTSTQYWITEVTDALNTNSTPTDPVDLVVNPKPNSSKIYQYDKP